MNDCRAVRLAGAFSRRFGAAAGEQAATRRDRAISAGNHVKADLFVAVHTVLRDHGSVFSRSRG